MLDILDEEVITPLLLDFVIADFLKARDNARNELQLLVLRLDVLLNAIL